MIDLNEEQLKVFNRLRKDLNFFASQCLKIQTKYATIEPLVFNDSQIHFHNQIERHKRERGNVRIVVVKGRQQGISTYTEARFFHRCSYNRGFNSFIASEAKESTNNIFSMVKRYYNNIPEGMPKPRLQSSNAKELIFEDIDSQIRTGTAGNKNVGVSTTNHLVHCSETALWTNGSEIIRGLFQTVPNNEKSEIIIESTARGVGGIFYELAMQGLEDNGDWETVFLPWFMHKEYQTHIEEDFRMTEEEEELQRLYKLTPEQLAWRKWKINGEFKGREWLFKQEYPCNVNEAFSSSGDGLIEPRLIDAARKNEMSGENLAPVCMGVDPARSGGDRTIIAIRQGRKLLMIIKYDHMQQMELAGIIATLIKDYNVKKCWVDAAHGYGTVDRLNENGFQGIVETVQFNQRPMKTQVYSNKRAEIHGEMRDWFGQDGGVSIPDNDELAVDLYSIPDFKYNSNSAYVLPSKDEIKKVLKRSPDMADALALTFAGIVPIMNEDQNSFSRYKVVNKRRGRG